MTDPVCKDIISLDIADTEKLITDLYANIENETDEQQREDYQAILNEFAIGVDRYEALRLTLAWGGPGIFIDVIHKNGDIQNIIYHYQEWYDGATEYVKPNTAIWRYAEEQLEQSILLST